MCWATINNFVDQQMKELQRSGNHRLLEGRLSQSAGQANERQPGVLDDPARSMKELPPDLRGIKKYRIGRHRIFYTGSHHLCEYRMIYIKKFKKAGTEDENDKKFQEKLKRLIDGPAHRKLTSDQD